MSYQSQFGKEEWLDPKTDKTLEKWGKQGMGRVDVICPGFAADCLETIEEIDVENREIFQDAGGGEFHYIPALNDGADHISALASIVHRSMGPATLETVVESAESKPYNSTKAVKEAAPAR